MKSYRVVKGLKIATFAICALALVTFFVMTLWNGLMPAIFAVKAISFWQALGLLALSKLLFGGLRGFPGRNPRWRQRMFERWEQMTPEEREKFRHGIRSRCGDVKVTA